MAAPGSRRGRSRELTRIGGRVRTRTYVAISAGFFAALLCVWILAAYFDWANDLFLPSPLEVWNRLGDLARDGRLWEDAKNSIPRIAIGFAISTAIALPLGILAGAFRVWDAAFIPLVEFLRYPPVVAFVPLTIIWIGIGSGQKWAIVFLGTFFQQVILVMDDTRQVPHRYVEVGRTLGMSEREILRRVVVPSAAPAIWDSTRICLGWAWTWLVLAENVNAVSGFGYRLNRAQVDLDSRIPFAYIAVLGFIGLATDQLMKWGGRRLFGWSGRGR